MLRSSLRSGDTRSIAPVHVEWWRWGEGRAKGDARRKCEGQMSMVIPSVRPIPLAWMRTFVSQTAKKDVEKAVYVKWDG